MEHDALDSSPLLTVPEVSERLRVSPYTVRRLVRSGQIPALRVGAQIRVSRFELEAWLFEDSSCGHLTDERPAGAPSTASPAGQPPTRRR
jgi:excisionase family DNA binding protein